MYYLPIKEKVRVIVECVCGFYLYMVGYCKWFLSNTQHTETICNE